MSTTRATVCERSQTVASQVIGIELARVAHDGALVRRAAELVRELADGPAVGHELRHVGRLLGQALEPRPAVLLDGLRASAQWRVHVPVDERHVGEVDHARAIQPGVNWP